MESMEQEMGGVQLEEFDQMAVGTMDEADDVGEGESPMEGYEGYVPYDKKMESKDKTVESKKVNMSKTKSGLVSNTAPVFDKKNVVEETREKVGTFNCETFHQANTVTCCNAVFHSEAFLSQDRDHLDLCVPSVLLIFLSAPVFLLLNSHSPLPGNPR